MRTSAETEEANTSQSWYDQLARQSSHSQGLTIGLISGHRYPNDPRCIFKVASRMRQAMSRYRGSSGLLVCRLDIHCPLLGRWGAEVEQQVEPVVEKSALGEWFQVDVSMTLGSSAPWTLQQLPRWLPKWKLRFSLILVDLGPIHLVSSRTIGRLCDANYILIGPNSSASAQWLMQYVDYHQYCGSPIAGTIMTRFAA